MSEQQVPEPITIGVQTFHFPFADLLPPLTDEEYAALRDDIREHGVQVDVMIVPSDDENERHDDAHYDVIDGQHRVRIAHELGLNVPYKVVHLEQAMQRDLAWNLNAHRRHMTPEQRQEYALKFRKDGLSYRAIGEKLGVSPATALADVKGSGVQSQTPETVTGLDGKQYQATRPTPPAPTEAQVAIVLNELWQEHGPIHRNALLSRCSRKNVHGDVFPQILAQLVKDGQATQDGIMYELVRPPTEEPATPSSRVLDDVTARVTRLIAHAPQTLDDLHRELVIPSSDLVRTTTLLNVLGTLLASQAIHLDGEHYAAGPGEAEVVEVAQAVDVAGQAILNALEEAAKRYGPSGRETTRHPEKAASLDTNAALYDSALDALAAAGKVIVDASGVSLVAPEAQDDLEKEASRKVRDWEALARAYEHRILRALDAGPLDYHGLREALGIALNEMTKISAMRRALDTLFGEQNIHKPDGGTYALGPKPEAPDAQAQPLVTADPAASQAQEAPTPAELPAEASEAPITPQHTPALVVAAPQSASWALSAVFQALAAVPADSPEFDELHPSERQELLQNIAWAQSRLAQIQTRIRRPLAVGRWAR